MCPTGEELSWAQQEGPTDPLSSLNQHFKVNEPRPEDPLFAYKDGSRRSKHLTKSKFLERLHKAAIDADLDPCKGHGIRIGATLEYLLRGLSFETVKSMGRWKGDSFTLYLRKHAQIMAPYIQAVPAIQEQILRITMPRVR